MVAIYLIYIFTTSTAKGPEKAVKRSDSLKYTHASAQYDRGVARGTTTAYYRRPHLSHTEADSVGTDFTDGDYVSLSSIDGPAVDIAVKRTPGYVFILQKLDSKGNKTDFYKFEFCEELPHNNNFVPEFKMVPGSCKHVLCINKVKENVEKIFEEYAHENGLYKPTDSHVFMVLYDKLVVQIYKTKE